MDAIAGDVPALNARHGIPGRLAFAARFGGTIAELRHEGASVVVAVQGAQVLSYEPEGCGEVLWLSPQARLDTGKAVRGGIPVCWPWFGPHPGGGGQPAHGFVRTRNWHVVEGLERGQGVGLRLALTSQDLTAASWREDVSVEVVVQLDDHLDVALVTQNFGHEALTITQALHTYLRVGDIDAVTIDGLQNTPFIDQLAMGSIKRETHALRITQETDRIYQDSEGPVTLCDAVLGRRIVISKTQSRSTVVWNPWIEKSARLGDMGALGYRHMVCIETANAGSDAAVIAPGHSHALTANIRAVRA